MVAVEPSDEGEEAPGLGCPIYSCSLIRPWRALPCICSLSILLTCISLSGVGARARVSYATCVRRCEEVFPNVVSSEKTCAATIRDIHAEFASIKKFLQKKHKCRGRYRKTCKTWKKKAVASLNRLIALTLNTGDCKALDASGIRQELHIFSPAGACRGDKRTTDFHDLMATSRQRVRQLNGMASRYNFVKDRFDPTKDYQGQRPSCAQGQKPSRYYVWPLLQFYFALEGLTDYQLCMSKCKKPTPTQELLWELEDRFVLLKDRLGAIGADEQTFVKERSESRSSLPGSPFSCRALSKTERNLSMLRDGFVAVEKQLQSLLPRQNPAPRQVVELKRAINEVESRSEEIDWVKVREKCRQEDELVKKLLQRKRRIGEEILTSEDFSLKAAAMFESSNGKGKECTSVVDCEVPLLCVEGACRGSISLPAVRLLMEHARRLKDKAAKLNIRSADGLLPNAERGVAALENELALLRKELNGSGWGKAVREWRTRFQSSVKARLDGLEAGIERSRAEFGQLHTLCVPEVKEECGKQLDELALLAEEVQRIRETLGTIDPVSGPTWVQIRVQDMERAEARYVELTSTLSTVCSEQPDREFPVIQILAGVVLLSLCAVVAIVVARRRGRDHERS